MGSLLPPFWSGTSLNLAPPRNLLRRGFFLELPALTDAGHVTLTGSAAVRASPAWRIIHSRVS